MSVCTMAATLAAAQSTPWGEVLINRILVVLSVFLMLLCLKDFFFLSKPLVGCIGRAKGSISLQHNLSSARRRDLLFAANFIPFCLLADRFSFYRPSFIAAIPQEWRVPVTIAAAAAFILLRLILYTALRPGRLSSDVYDGAKSTLYNFIIIYMTAALPLFMVLYALHVPETVTGKILLYFLGVTYTIGTVRCIQIFGSVFSVIRTFLYLCALEFLPLALLMASAVVF